MKSIRQRPPSEEWNVSSTNALIDQLRSLRESMLGAPQRFDGWLRAVDPAHEDSATNLVHYLAMRGADLRELQQHLAKMGVSSLGRAETHVLANVDKVIGILHRLAGRSWATGDEKRPVSFERGTALLAQHAEALFGEPPKERDVRIMVTLPSEAAHDASMVRGMVNAGMDVARINCAHDGPAEWAAMAWHVRAAAQRLGRPVRVLMDLAGPKVRTGPIAGSVAVVTLHPERDALGRVTANARLGLRPRGSLDRVEGATVHLGVDASWLRRLQVGASIALTDARGAGRKLAVVRRETAGVLVESDHTAYLTEETCLRVHRKHHRAHETLLGDFPAASGRLHLQRGQLLHLVADGQGHDAAPPAKGRRARPASLACTLPEVLAQVRKGQHVWFDDGQIGAVVLRAGAKRLELEITEARDGGSHLAADKGINLPDTRLDLPALTPKDLQDLEAVAQHADLVGLSFAQSAEDVHSLRRHLAERGVAHLGLILKIETRRGFEHLPEMLLAAMTGSAAGVMIARGDLAVECGYERMAEVQEEILWVCEAAHMPVVWATQVLESLAKTGLPSRAEVTDAAMGARAECVMLNKGPHILEAMRTLNDILRRMQSHQLKKRPLLRALKAWQLPKPVPATLPPVVAATKPIR
jgi:pyruvate kinase